MNILEQFDHPGRKQDKDHIIHLIQIAMADGIVDDKELKMLQRLGNEMGITDPEITDLLENSKKSAYIPPYEFSKRFGQIYHVIKMVYADDKVDSHEMRLATLIGLKSGFSEEEMPFLLTLLITGVKNNENEEDLFELYKKRRIVR